MITSKHPSQFTPHSSLTKRVAFTLAEVFSPHFAGCRKAAFTLAEVLITLGIIGVVAAMTLPTLVAKYQEKARITNLKKIYAQLQNAYNMAAYEYGPFSTWGLANTKTDEVNENGEFILDNSGRLKAFQYLAKYIKKANVNNISQRPVYALDGRLFTENSSVNYDKSEELDETFLLTADGFKLEIGWINDKQCDFWVTLPNEKKDIMGVTKFYFQVTDKGFKPFGETQTSFHGYCNIKGGNSSNLNGRSCTAWALYNENMEYLRCNDLSWNGKNKCN